ncbi:hypothetical protein FRC11_003693 [Ceratobasidium sp. 423]|nr:hypothetical protein FRC11_003693 [Ceratobasidium sp. 423]
MVKCMLKELGDIGALSDLDNFKIAKFTVQSGLSVWECEQMLKLKKFEGQMAWLLNFKMMQDVNKLPIMKTGGTNTMS